MSIPVVDIAAGLAALEGDNGLLAEEAFTVRFHALEELEVGAIDALEVLAGHPGHAPSLATLRRRAEALQVRLARADARLFARLRREIEMLRAEIESIRERQPSSP